MHVFAEYLLESVPDLIDPYAPMNDDPAVLVA